MFLFSFHPSLQTVRHHAESSGLEKSSRREGGVQPAEVKGESAAGQGVGVCVYVGVGGGQTQTLSLFFNPPPLHTSQTDTLTTGLLYLQLLIQLGSKEIFEVRLIRC